MPRSYVVAKRPDGAGVARQTLTVVGGLAVAGGDLEVGLEADAVGRVEEDHLHAAAEAFALGEGGHDTSRFAVDQPVLPVAGVLVPLVGGVG